jgi:hypothetical protein
MAMWSYPSVKRQLICCRHSFFIHVCVCKNNVILPGAFR